MYTYKHQLRPRYSEIDKMGFVYYGNYAAYFEAGRVEALRNLGISYKEIEDRGIVMPVLHYSIDYKKPALYDELLTIEVSIPFLPELRVQFDYETRNEKNELLNTGTTTLVFMKHENRKPVQPPEEFLAALRGFYG